MRQIQIAIIRSLAAAAKRDDFSQVPIMFYFSHSRWSIQLAATYIGIGTGMALNLIRRHRSPVEIIPILSL